MVIQCLTTHRHRPKYCLGIFRLRVVKDCIYSVNGLSCLDTVKNIAKDNSNIIITLLDYILPKIDYFHLKPPYTVY